MARGSIITDLKVGPGGVAEDVSPPEIPEGFWQASSNLLLRNGVGRPRPGTTEVTSAANPAASDIVTGFGFRGSPETTANLIAHTLTKAYQYDGTTLNDITGTWTTSTAAQPVRMVPFWAGTTLVIVRVNEANAVDEWNGAGSFTSSTGAVAARDVTVCGNRIIVAGVTTGGAFTQRVQWSDFKSTTFTAGQYDEATETPGEIVAVRSFGPLSFGIYKEDAVSMGQLQASTTIFQFQFVGRTIGPAGPAALVATPEGVHYWMGKNGLLYRFDGSKPEVVGGLNRTAVQNFAYARRMEAHGALLATPEPEIWWWYPESGNAYMRTAACLNLKTMRVTPHTFAQSVTASSAWLSQGSLTYDTLTGTIDGLSDLYATYDSMTSAAQPTLVAGHLTTSSSAVRLAQFGLSLADRGTAIPWSVTFPPRALNGGGRVFLDGVRQYWKQTATSLTVTVGVTLSDSLSDDSATTDVEQTDTFDMSTASNHMLTFADATPAERVRRYSTVRVAADSQVASMEWRGMQMLGWPRGAV